MPESVSPKPALLPGHCMAREHGFWKRSGPASSNQALRYRPLEIQPLLKGRKARSWYFEVVDAGALSWPCAFASSVRGRLSKGLRIQASSQIWMSGRGGERQSEGSSKDSSGFKLGWYQKKHPATCTYDAARHIRLRNNSSAVKRANDDTRDAPRPLFPFSTKPTNEGLS